MPIRSGLQLRLPELLLRWADGAEYDYSYYCLHQPIKVEDLSFVTSACQEENN